MFTKHSLEMYILIRSGSKQKALLKSQRTFSSVGSQFEIKHLRAAFERTSVMTHFGQRRRDDICPGCPLKSWRRALLWPFSVQAVDHQSKCKAPSVHCFALPSSRAQIYHISEISSLFRSARTSCRTFDFSRPPVPSAPIFPEFIDEL